MISSVIPAEHSQPRLVFAFFVLISIIGPAMAEEPVELDDLLVTAALEPIEATDVATSVTVITREQIEQRQVRYLSDLLRDVPGFAVSQSGGPGAQTQVRVRGAEANHLLVLIDGIRANDPASGDEFQFEYQTTANIERIEIIRGPQSAIWGTDALAGVINIITRKSVNESYLNGEAEYGSLDTLSLAARGGLSRERMRLYGGVAYLDSEGINISRTGNEKDGSRNVNGNLNFEYDISDSWQLRVNGQRVENDNEFDGFDFFETGLPADADLVAEARRSYASGQLLYGPDDGELTASVGLFGLDSKTNNFSDGVWDSSTSADKLEFRARGSLAFGAERDHRLTLAFDHEDTDFAQRGIATPFGDPNQDQSYDRTGYAAEYVGSPFEGFHWTANGRYDDFSDFDSALTWQLAASHQFSSRLSVRAAAGRSHQGAGIQRTLRLFPRPVYRQPGTETREVRGLGTGLRNRS